MQESRGARSSCRSPPHDEPGCEHLNDVAMLVARLISHDDCPSIWTRARRGDLDELALDMQTVARPRRLRPAQLAARADNAADERQPLLDNEPHGKCRGAPAARRQSAEQRALCGLVAAVQGLWIELACEGFDLGFVDLIRSRD